MSVSETASVSPSASIAGQGPDLADLKRKSARGGVVTLAGQGISIAIQLASTVILARLLTPDSYGVIAMVMTITGFVGLFRDLGLSTAAIQRKDITVEQRSNLFWLNVGMGTLLTLAVSALAPAVAWFYGKPELLLITVVQSTAFLIGGLGAQHDAMLTRDMAFTRKAAISIAGSLLTLIVSVVMAWQGYSYWSLVAGSLSGAVLSTVLLFVFCPMKVVWFSRASGTMELMCFGAGVTANSVVFYLCRNVDNILIGRVWGPAELGMYSRAYSLLMLPINAIKGPLESVSFASLCKLQDRPDEFRDYYRTLVRFTALISMPFSGGLLACSGPLIAIALGPQWHEVTSIFSVLAIVAMMQPTASLWGIMLLGLGRSKRLLTCSVINAAIFITGMAIGVYWKGIGVAIGYAVSYYIALPIILVYAFRNSPVSVRDFARDIVRPLVASIVASVAALALARFVHTDSHVIDLIIRAAGFVMSFGVLFFLMPGSKADLALIKRSASILRPKAKA